jgi:serine/threonine protein kinase
MHSQNVIHRDIKLENIMLGQLNDLGTAKIADFGFAIQVANQEEREKVGWESVTVPKCESVLRTGGRANNNGAWML